MHVWMLAVSVFNNLALKNLVAFIFSIWKDGLCIINKNQYNIKCTYVCMYICILTRTHTRMHLHMYISIMYLNAYIPTV